MHYSINTIHYYTIDLGTAFSVCHCYCEITDTPLTTTVFPWCKMPNEDFINLMYPVLFLFQATWWRGERVAQVPAVGGLLEAAWHPPGSITSKNICLAIYQVSQYLCNIYKISEVANKLPPSLKILIVQVIIFHSETSYPASDPQLCLDVFKLDVCLSVNHRCRV